MDPTQIVSIISTVFSAAEKAAGLLPGRSGERVLAAISFSQDVVELVATAEEQGLSETAVIQDIGDLYAAFLRRYKTGVT
jgi:hypothetical protein